MNIALVLVILVTMLSGCSSVSVHDPMGANQKKIVELTYCVSSSSEMTTLKDAISDKKNKEEFNKNIEEALADISIKLTSGIKHTKQLHITIMDACPESEVDVKQTSDLYLTIELSGYGSLKEEWKDVLVGTGIAEGIIQGIIVGAATANPWLGVAVGAEEITSEYLTWNGVDWVLGEAYAPVTLEGTLFYVKNNEVIWQDSSFVTENEDALTNIEKKDKALQLKASLFKAEEELISSLNDYLQNEILKNITSSSTLTGAENAPAS